MAKARVSVQQAVADLVDSANERLCDLEEIIESDGNAWATLVAAVRTEYVKSGANIPPQLSPAERCNIAERIQAKLTDSLNMDHVRLDDSQLDDMIMERSAAFRLGLQIGRQLGLVHGGAR